jgi:ankyrin repeat protein
VKYLLQHGAQVNLQNRNGETALHTAAQHGYLETVKELTAAGADPAIRSNSGRGFSAADLAWSSNQIAVSKFLDSLKVR